MKTGCAGSSCCYRGLERGGEGLAAAPVVHRAGGVGQQDGRHGHAARPDRQRRGEAFRQLADDRPGRGDLAGADAAHLAGLPASRDAKQVLPVARQGLAAGQRNDVPGPRGQQPRRFRWHAGRQRRVQRRAGYPRAHPVGGPAGRRPSGSPSRRSSGPCTAEEERWSLWMPLMLLASTWPRRADSGIIDRVQDKTATAPHRVAALACNGVTLFELAVANDVFGTIITTASGDPLYSLSVCGPAPSVMTDGGLRVEVPHGLDALAVCGDRRRAAIGGSRLGPRSGARRPAAGQVAGPAHRLAVHGRVRAGGRGTARRAHGDDALVGVRGSRAPVSAGVGGPEGAVHRRRRPAHLRRERGQPRSLPAPGAARPRDRDRRQGGTRPRRPAAQARRPGAVHRDADAAARRRRPVRRHDRLAAGAPRRAGHGRPTSPRGRR